MQALAKQNQNIIYQHTGTASNISLDGNLLKNCVINLIGNAIKYSGENTFIEFNTEVTEDECIVTIKDNGIGIPEAMLPRVFERFFRADPSRTQVEGSGLGLAIARWIADMHHAAISVESVEGRGTVFRVVFPSSC